MMDADLKVNQATRVDGAAQPNTETGTAAGESSLDRTVEISACSHCGRHNPSARKFCGQCGQSLTDACLACGGVILPGERFCGCCGADIEQLTQQKRETVEADLARARRMCKAGRFSEAKRVLGQIAKLQHSRLADQLRVARSVLKQIESLREETEFRAKSAATAAEQALSDGDWTRAVEQLESVPPALVTPRQQEMLEQARQAIEEIKALRRGIAADLKSGRPAAAAPKVERLRQLQPHSQEAQRLAAQLRRAEQRDHRAERDSLIAAAQKHWRRSEYSKACERINAVAEDVLTPEIRKQRERLREAASLEQALRRSPYAEPALLELGARLQQLTPQDQRIAGAVAQLKQRLAQRSQTAPLKWTTWARTPETTYFDKPLKPLIDFGGIALTQTAEQPKFADNAHRLYVACGLALQALGEARIDTNLLPKRSGGWTKLSGLVHRRKASGDAWGIDISSTSIKAVCLSRGPKSGEISLAAFDIVEHARHLDQAKDFSERRQLLSDSFQTVIDRNELKGRAVCLGMPGPWSLVRFLTLPPTDPKRLPDLLKYEVKQHVPLPIDQLEWDYHLWESDAGQGETNAVRVLLTAGRREPIKQRVDALVNSGQKITSVQSDCIALYNFYDYAFAGAAPADSATALVDLGGDALNFVVHQPGQCWFRSVAGGADRFCKAVARRFDLSLTAADRQLRCPAQTRSHYRLMEALAPSLDAVRKEIAESLRALESHDRLRAVGRLWMIGGGIRAPGLLAHLLHPEEHELPT